METVESAEETFRKIIGPNWNKKETLKIKHVCTNCKAIFETATELDKHTNGEKVNAGEYIGVSENASVKFNPLSLLNPALDVKPENSGIMLVVPMPGIRTRDCHDKQGKVVDTKKTSDIIQCVVTDEREMFEAEDEADHRTEMDA